MKFTFRLQTLWKLRVSQRDERQRRLAEAQQADEVLQRMSAEVEAELEETQESCRRGSQPGVIDVDQLLITQRYELVLTARRGALREQREQLAAEIERRRLAVVEADRQVKVLQKLRDKQWAEHHRREQQREVKRLDEIAQRRPQWEQTA